jgi:hypothetical protein
VQLRLLLALLKKKRRPEKNTAKLCPLEQADLSSVEKRLPSEFSTVSINSGGQNYYEVLKEEHDLRWLLEL